MFCMSNDRSVASTSFCTFPFLAFSFLLVLFLRPQSVEAAHAGAFVELVMLQ